LPSNGYPWPVAGLGHRKPGTGKWQLDLYIMSLLSILGIGNGKIKEALKRGTVIDVRTASDFDQGKVRTSINIPTDRISINLQRIRQMRKPIVICSNSDSESEKVIGFLKASGLKEIYNGGPWTRVLKIARSI
jgi:phage shock protein E